MALSNKKNNSFSWKNKKILITGGGGFVGNQVKNFLIEKKHVSSSHIIIPRSKTTDLRNYKDAQKIVKGVDIVLHLAADVGGINYSSQHPASQMRNCMLIDLNMFEAAAQAKVEKFVCVSSAVAYPVEVSSPLQEEDLFSGIPAKGGYGYGFAKRMSVVMAKAYSEEKGLNVCVLLSANSYGPGDDFDLESGHVIPSLIKKCLTQKELEVWGDGTQVRDFLYVKDFAEAIITAAEKLNSPEPINIGTGKGVSIKELVKIVAKETNFKGKIFYDTSKPTGQKIRIPNNSKMKESLGFQPKFSIEEGIKETVEWYKKIQQKKLSGKDLL